MARVEVHGSALKHGVAEEDVVQVASSYLLAIPLDEDDQRTQDEDPPRELRLGFDAAGRLLEVIVLLLDDDRRLR